MGILRRRNRREEAKRSAGDGVERDTRRVPKTRLNGQPSLNMGTPDGWLILGKKFN